MWHSFPLQALGINLSSSSDNFLKLFLIFVDINTEICLLWGINLFLVATILHHLKTPWLKKSHFTKYLETSKREIWMFTFIHLNFEWKHSNLRLRLYWHWIKIIISTKWPHKCYDHWCNLTYIPLMFCINEIPISSTIIQKKALRFFTVTLWSFINSLLLFSVIQHNEKRCDPPISFAWRIIEQPLRHYNNVSDVVLGSSLLILKTFHTFFWCFYYWLWTGKWLLGTFRKTDLNFAEKGKEIYNSSVQQKL